MTKRKSGQQRWALVFSHVGLRARLGITTQSKPVVNAPTLAKIEVCYASHYCRGYYQ